MTYPTWKDKQTGATRHGAEIVAHTLDYQGATDEDDAQVEQPAVESPRPCRPSRLLPHVWKLISLRLLLLSVADAVLSRRAGRIRDVSF